MLNIKRSFSFYLYDNSSLKQSPVFKCKIRLFDKNTLIINVDIFYFDLYTCKIKWIKQVFKPLPTRFSLQAKIYLDFLNAYANLILVNHLCCKETYLLQFWNVLQRYEMSKISILFLLEMYFAWFLTPNLRCLPRI